VTYNPDEKPYVQQRRHFRPSKIGEPLAITVYDFTDYGRTWIDNVNEKLGDVITELKKAYDHGELDATHHASMACRLAEMTDVLTVLNSRNKNIGLRAGSRRRDGWRE
jgi:hypothetical protein